MAGGAQVGGTTILETPPYILALVFTFFLVVTLSFEHVRDPSPSSVHLTYNCMCAFTYSA